MSIGTYNNVEIAEIRVTVNKYRPYIHPFYIANLVPYKSNATDISKGKQVSKSNITNKEPDLINIEKFPENGIIFIPLPNLSFNWLLTE